MINFTDIFWILSLKGDNAQYKVYKCLGIKNTAISPITSYPDSVFRKKFLLLNVNIRSLSFVR